MAAQDSYVEHIEHQRDDYMQRWFDACKAKADLAEALEAWTLWWSSLPRDSQCDNHDAAYEAITKTRAALALAKGEE